MISTDSLDSVLAKIADHKVDTNLEFQFFLKIEYVEEMILKKNLYHKYEDVWDAIVEFKPFTGLACTQVDEIVLLVMLILTENAYCFAFEGGKFTVVYTIKDPEKIKEDKEYTISTARGLSLSADGIDAPDRRVYNEIYFMVSEQSEKYPNLLINNIRIRFYLIKHKEKAYKLSSIEMKRALFKEIYIKGELSETLDAPSMARKPTVPDYITALKFVEKKEPKAFIVADFETVPYPRDQNDDLSLPTHEEEVFEDEMYLLDEGTDHNPLDTTIIKKEDKGRLLKSSQASIDDDVDKTHVAYAAGFLVVNPGDDVASKPDHLIESYYIEEESTIFPSFRERSKRLIWEFLERLVDVANKTKIRVVYFHNLSRFDGFLLLEYLTSGVNFSFKTTMRNHSLYEIRLYKGKNLVYKIRDSYFLLPGSLSALAENLCPEIGPKGEIDHDNLKVEELPRKKNEIMVYMRQDIRLLGGVMQKAQTIYNEKFNVDIVNCLTLPSLALTIYRMKYYDPQKTPIHLPSRNQDSFIRSGYYGGHSDVYSPIGRNLYVYDVNSLYPFIMANFPMPCGPAVWYRSFSGIDLSDKIGFVKAYVRCPSSMDRPFLPYRNSNKKKDQSLIFPTGDFVGVYFTAELEYAKMLGYQIFPFCGYLFQKTDSNPFKTFVGDLYDSRQEAKKTGKKAMSYIYKLIMNSLYGRFGINPQSTITEICDYQRHCELLESDLPIVFWNKVTTDIYVVNYKVNTVFSDTHDWKPPKNSAVHIAAAITAYARIHMFPFISRSDCVYTDTDSAFLSNPLPEEEISQDIIGKVKLEMKVDKGIFLAPKAYALRQYDGTTVVKHKGRAKDFVNYSWFELQLKDLGRVFEKVYLNKFFPDRKRFQLCIKKTKYILTIPDSKKREKVINSKNLWVKTKPKHVIDYGDEPKTCELINQAIDDMKKTNFPEILKKVKESRIEKERVKMLVEKEKMLVEKETEEAKSSNGTLPP